jgi:hypothetical protein
MTTPDHHLAAAREQRMGVAAPTTPALLDSLSSHLDKLDRALADLVQKLSPVLTEEDPHPLVEGSGLEPRTDLARRLDDLAGRAHRLVMDVARTIERVEL